MEAEKKKMNDSYLEIMTISSNGADSSNTKAFMTKKITDDFKQGRLVKMTSEDVMKNIQQIKVEIKMKELEIEMAQEAIKGLKKKLELVKLLSLTSKRQRKTDTSMIYSS